MAAHGISDMGMWMFKDPGPGDMFPYRDIKDCRDWFQGVFSEEAEVCVDTAAWVMGQRTLLCVRVICISKGL